MTDRQNQSLPLILLNSAATDSFGPPPSKSTVAILTHAAFDPDASVLNFGPIEEG